MSFSMNSVAVGKKFAPVAEVPCELAIESENFARNDTFDFCKQASNKISNYHLSTREFSLMVIKMSYKIDSFGKIYSMFQESA